MQLVNKNPDVCKQFIRLLANNVTEKEQQLLNIAYNSLRKRVANALIQLKNKYHTDSNEPFSIQISREDLSNIAGTATESLIRTLGDFRQEKLVEINGSKITIVNEGKLEGMIN
jgi:CRP-like cAMP-binding protein